MHHNAKSPIDMRNYPVCYLCAGEWGPHSVDRNVKRIAIECLSCGLCTWAKIDAQVLEARLWKKLYPDVMLRY